MTKLKGGPRKRFHIWIPESQLKDWLAIENRSKFVQICLEQEVGIMAWHILKQRDPKNYYEVDTQQLEDVVDDFNALYPLDPLTKKRFAKEQNERAQRTDSGDGPQSDSELW